MVHHAMMNLQQLTLTCVLVAVKQLNHFKTNKLFMPQLQSWKASFEEEVARTKLDENEVFSLDCVSFHITGL